MRIRLRLLGVTVVSVVVDLHDGLEVIDEVEESTDGGWKFEAHE